MGVVCIFCGKEFWTWPYLASKGARYCSRDCYWNATRKKERRICIVCGKGFEIKLYLINQGFGKFCSRECQFYNYKNKRVVCVCKQCGRKFTLYPSAAKKAKFCSRECKDAYERDYVERTCLQCEKKFLLPRWELEKGKGTFCSRECFFKFNGETSIEKIVRQALETMGVEFRQQVKIGQYYLDFLLSKAQIVIECDGNYWHNVTGAYERDRRKDRFLKSRGYKVYRFGEDEIKSSITSCLQQLPQLSRS
jgi:very-short-patch-repair endonuclease